MTPTEQNDTKEKRQELRELAEKNIESHYEFQVEHMLASGLIAALDRLERAEEQARHSAMAADAEARDRDEWRERALRAEAAAIGWNRLFDSVAIALNCLPSAFVDGNAHVIEAARSLAAAPSAPVAASNPDAGENAPWLTLAHMICSDAGISPGCITGRLEALREKLAAQAEPVLWFKRLDAAHALPDGRCYSVVFTEVPDHQPLYATPPAPMQEAGDDCDRSFDDWYAMQRHQLTNEQVCRLIWRQSWARAIATSKEEA